MFRRFVKLEAIWVFVLIFLNARCSLLRATMLRIRHLNHLLIFRSPMLHFWALHCFKVKSLIMLGQLDVPIFPEQLTGSNRLAPRMLFYCCVHLLVRLGYSTFYVAR